MKCILFTASELRHDFMRKALGLSPDIEVLRTFCEVKEHKLQAVIQDNTPGADLQAWHLEARKRSERDFFGAFSHFAPDVSNPVQLEYGAVNEPGLVEELMALGPELLCAYGCSLIREPLLSALPGRFVNVHLGLSPYYRGTGTNFWPLVNAEPEYVGATFMHIDAGVDTGKIIHQIRARILPGDTPHQIGNRLIADIAVVYAELIRCFDGLQEMEQPPAPRNERVYMRKDFSPESVRQLYDNFAGGLVDRHLEERETRESRAPLVVNPALQSVALP